MSQFQHPYQRLCLIRAGRKTLVAAAGPRLYTFDFEEGSLLSYWPAGPRIHPPIPLVPGAEGGDEDTEPPGKRRKVESPDQENYSRGSSVSAEIVVDKPPKGARRRTKIIDPSLPNVSHLVRVRGGRFIVVVTAEDKCLRVFFIDPYGNLKLESERQVPSYSG